MSSQLSLNDNLHFWGSFILVLDGLILCSSKPSIYLKYALSTSDVINDRITFIQSKVYFLDSPYLFYNNYHKPSFQTSTEERMSSCHIFHNTSYSSMHYNVAIIMHIKHFFQKRFEYIVKMHLSMSQVIFLFRSDRFMFSEHRSMSMILLVSTDIDSHHGY